MQLEMFVKNKDEEIATKDEEKEFKHWCPKKTNCYVGGSVCI